MYKKSFLLVVFLSNYLFASLPPLSEIRKAINEVEKQGPEYGCLENSSFQDCEIQLLKFNKAIYFNKMREIAIKTKSINNLEKYLEYTKKTNAYSFEKDSRFVEEAINKLVEAYRYHGLKNKDSSLFKKSYLLNPAKSDIKNFFKFANTKEIENNLNFTSVSHEKLFKKYSLNKLREISSKNSYFVAYMISNDKSDFNEVIKRLSEKSSKSNTEILNYYFNKNINSISSLSEYLELLKKCKDCDIKNIKKNIVSKSFFMKNLTAKNFLNSIQYKYVLKDIGYSIQHKRKAKQYSIIISPNNINRSIKFTFESICTFDRKTVKRENTGLLTQFFSLGMARDKRVYYDILKCTALKNKDKKVIHRLYNSSNYAHLYTKLKNDTWEYYKKTREEYLESQNNSNSIIVTPSCIGPLCTVSNFKLSGTQGFISMGYNTAFVNDNGNGLSGTYNYSVKLSPSKKICTGSFDTKGIKKNISINVYEHNCSGYINEF